MERNLSCPPVSQNKANKFIQRYSEVALFPGREGSLPLMTRESMIIVFGRKSIPIVETRSLTNSFLINLVIRLDFPVAESPSKMTKESKFETDKCKEKKREKRSGRGEKGSSYSSRECHNLFDHHQPSPFPETQSLQPLSTSTSFLPQTHPCSCVVIVLLVFHWTNPLIDSVKLLEVNKPPEERISSRLSGNDTSTAVERIFE
jgi:hypothetical protein